MQEFFASPREINQIRKIPVHLLAMCAIIKLPPQTPFDALRHQERLEAVREALDSLPERQRMIMTMHCLDGRTLDETGEAFNLSRERIRQIVKAGINQLRKPTLKNRRLRTVAMEAD